MRDTKFSIRQITCIILAICSFSITQAQDYQWTTDANAIYRDGQEFFLHGQSWAKKTPFLDGRGVEAESDVKQVLTELHSIGVNTLRIYGSPNDSDWDGSPNFDLLIQWIEEWNLDNPDGGDPNNAMYYLVQISPGDPQSSINSNLPENSSESFDRSINDLTNPESVASLVKKVDDITGGSQYLLGYLIYHEFNVSSKYADWVSAIGHQGIEDFMNITADSLHNQYAPGKLVSHTGDAKDDDNDIYQAIEELDDIQGNVFDNFDLIGFNLYISTDALLSENSFYQRIVNKRTLSINDNRGWYVGETGPSFDKSADPGSVAAANYTNPEGGANLQIMYAKTQELGNMMGFMLFTVQDNDKGETIGDAIKQRGYYDVYGDKKFLYFVYPDVVDETSTNHRKHYSEEHEIDLSIEGNGDNFNIELNLSNYSDQNNQTYLWTIHSDNGSGGSQRFGIEVLTEYVTLSPCESITLSESVEQPNDRNGSGLVVVSASLIMELEPDNQYLWGREHILSDAVFTVAGLNLYLDNEPLIGSTPSCNALPADLSLGWSTDVPDPFVGDTITYTLEATNSGVSDANEVLVDLSVSSGFSILNIDYTAGKLSTDSTQWLIGLMEKNQVVTLEVEVMLKESGEYDLLATISSLQDDNDLLNNQANFSTEAQEVLGSVNYQLLDKVRSGKLLLSHTAILKIPEGRWHVKIHDLTGAILFNSDVSNEPLIKLRNTFNSRSRVVIYQLNKLDDL